MSRRDSTSKVLAAPARRALRAFAAWAAFLISALAVSACREPESDAARAGVPGGKPPVELEGSAAPVPAVAAPDSGADLPLLHARGFAVRRAGGATWVEVKRPWQGARSGFRYRLVDRTSDDTLARPGDSAAAVIRVPARRILTLTTTNLPHLDALDGLDALVGIGGGKYACHPQVRARLAAGTLREVGEETHVDAEAALDLRPDLVLAFAVASSPYQGALRLRAAGLPVVIEAPYLEETPLGRAEWIKFTAAFLGQGPRADSLFRAVDSAYQALAALARGAARRPTVVVNAPFSGSWWIPGGRSFVATFLRDAGADYLWAEDTTQGALALDLESVLARAGQAEYWLNPGTWRSLGEARDKDPRHGLFRAFREGRVWNNDRALCGAGNSFHEQGSTRPDLVLADLIALFHPELLPGHRFRWYRKLEET